jgi:ABC-type bacteriocin/lantibiotic exporter with double-glycine peptidase domain
VTDVRLVLQDGRSDCGVAALAMMLGHWNRATDATVVRAAVGPPSSADGVSAGRLRDVAQARGLDAFLIEGTRDDLVHEIERGRPGLVGVIKVLGGKPYPHYELLTAINPETGRVLLADPGDGWHEEPWSRFELRWAAARHLSLVVMARASTGTSRATD